MTTDFEWTTACPPLADREIMELVRLWRTEWSHGDFDWIESLSGDYAATLRLTVVTARSNGRLAATATAVTREGGGEVALISSVMTAAEFRGRGLGAEATQRAVEEAISLGAQACFLGTNAWPHNVYQKIGFTRWNGIVMRRTATPGASPEAEWFAPDQPTVIREACWGDAPAFVALVIQPLDTVLLCFPRSLLSAKFVPLRRCVSNFAPLFTDCINSKGKLFVLAGKNTSRVFAFAAWSRWTGALAGTAWVEAAAHDHYANDLPRLIESTVECAEAGGATTLIGSCHSQDHSKLAAYTRCGFRAVAELAGVVGHSSVPGDLVVMQRLSSDAR